MKGKEKNIIYDHLDLGPYISNIQRTIYTTESEIILQPVTGTQNQDY